MSPTTPRHPSRPTRALRAATGTLTGDDIAMGAVSADIDMDGAIDFLDITPFVNLLDEVAAAVPEPTTAMLLVVMGFVAGRRHR